MIARLPRSVLRACALAPLVALVPGIVQVHRRIGASVATRLWDDTALSFPDYVFGVLLPILLSAPFFWSLTAELARVLRVLVRTVAIVFAVNVLALPNNPEAGVNGGYLTLLVLWLLTLMTGVVLIRRVIAPVVGRSLVAGVLLAVVLTIFAQWLEALGWSVLGYVSALGFASSFPWASAAGAVLLPMRGTETPRAEGPSLPDVLRRLTPDRAFSAVAVLVAAVSAWFSFQANQMQQDVRVQAHADQVLLLQRPADVTSASSDPTDDGDLDLVVENYSRLPARGVVIVAIVASRREAHGVGVGTIDSCQQARLSREALLAHFDERRAIADYDVDFVVWFADASGTDWQRRSDGPPSARESPVFGVQVAEVPVEKLPLAGCVPT